MFEKRDGRHVTSYKHVIVAAVWLCAVLALGCAVEDLGPDVDDADDADDAGDTGEDNGDLVDLEAAGTSPATGFWRIDRPADSERSWLVSPVGNRVWVRGVNTVMRNTLRDGHARCNGIINFLRRHAPTKAANIEWARLSDGRSGGYTVPKSYAFTSVGSFSDTNDLDGSGGLSYMVRAADAGGAGAPYSVVVTPAPRDDAYVLRNENGTVLQSGITGAKVGDPYNPAFHADLDARFAARIAPHRDDPRLQMWFVGNEAGMFDKGAKAADGVRDFRRWIWSRCPTGASIDNPTCARYAAVAFFRARYDGSIAALNTAWGSGYGSFADIVDGGAKPVPYRQHCNLTCREDMQRFAHDGLLREWIAQVTTRLRAADPNHLVATPRLALGNARAFRFYDGTESARPDVWVDSGNRVGRNRADIRYTPYDLFRRVGAAGFDVIAVNVYTGSATFEHDWFTDGIHKLQDQSGLPVFISEFSVRARIAGWSNRGGAGAFVPSGDSVEDQAQRGMRYRSQLKQFASFRHIVGASWHAWSDRYMPNNGAVQINMGLVQCADSKRGHTAGKRWTGADDGIRDANRRIYQYIANRTGL